MASDAKTASHASLPADSVAVPAANGSGQCVAPEAAERLLNIYLEIESTEMPAKGALPTVRLNFGRLLREQLGLSREEVKRLSERRFPSALDAANILGLAGWQLVSTDVYELRGARVNRWIMTKRVHHVNEVLDGLL